MEIKKIANGFYVILYVLVKQKILLQLNSHNRNI